MAQQKDIMLAFGYYDYRFHRGVARYAKEQGWHLTAEVVHARKIPWGWNGDGIIAKVYGGDALSRFVTEANVPVVNIGRGISRLFPLVLIDEESLTQTAVDHYLKRGFKNFAWFGPAPQHALSKTVASDLPNRPGLFIEKIRAAGFPCKILDWRYNLGRGGYSWEKEREWLQEQISSLDKPLAVFCEDDIRATNFVQTCRLANLKVPDEVSILGLNNDALICETVPVPVSSIDTDMEGRAYLAAKLLDQKMNGEEIPDRTYLPVKGIETRESTDTIVVDHPKVAEALHFIWNHYSTPINVTDVASKAGLSTRGLHKAFVKHLGRSPLQELQRVRLLRAQDLLKVTNMKINEIAGATGHESVKNLYRAFTHHCKLTPRKFRLKYQPQAEDSSDAESKQAPIPGPLFSRNLDEA